ncbi:helix-turn-helix domain-containing protein [Micromonospora sp. WMMD737]|uniref:helix-turn-helix domain-containing protein n=1 Tax=Micromonospora sp. WMMD737 TaxID=3404113 RepID=UPI003B94DD40
MGVITPAQVAEARKRIGWQLATRRDAAGLTQAELSRRIHYSRSTVATVEVGRGSATRQFWQRSDVEIGAGGALVAAFDQVSALVRDFQGQAGREGQRERQERAGPSLTSSPQGSGGCGCGIAVGRWTWREVRALREALRFGVRAFAEHLGVPKATAAGWEDQSTIGPPRLAMRILDQALRLADADTRARFSLIIANSGGRIQPESVYPAPTELD